VIVGRKESLISGFPEKLKRSTSSPELVYRISKEHYAVRGSSAPREPESPVFTLATDTGERIAVCRGDPTGRRELSEHAIITAVYSEPSSGGVVVPTGLVFVRFRDSIKAESKRQALERAGYRLVKLLAYAPNAAWVEAVSGDIAEALRNIGRLEELDAVENVEPQLLSKRASK
jgi:hypothetical protein